MKKLSECPHVCVEPSAINCSNFVETEYDTIAKVKTAVIAPIRISIKNGIIIAWQCSLSSSCRDLSCFYARIAKEHEDY